MSTGWPAVRDKCADLGITFDVWQDGTGRLILAKRADGSYATSVGGVVISIPRQVGKTFLLGAIVFALCMLYPGLTVIWTAHRLRTAGETFSAMQGMARRHKIKPFVSKIVLGSGEEEVQFHNGSRILFGARERGFGRGFSEVDVLVFDEAQILTENAIDDMVPATNQAANPLILFTGTPPKPTDPGEVFRRKRAEALAGESDDTVYIEFSADTDADPLDRAQWRKANPSYPVRTPVAAMQRMRKNLSEDSFVREALGIWEPPGSGALDMTMWASLTDSASAPLDPVMFSVDVSPDRSTSAVAVSGRRSDGTLHIEIVEAGPGVGWAVPRLAELSRKWTSLGVTLDAAGPAGSLMPELETGGMTVHAVSPREMGQACGAFFDAVMGAQLRHLQDPRLDAALAGARKRALGDAWAWARKSSTTDISPLVAVTLALHGASTRAPTGGWVVSI